MQKTKKNAGKPMISYDFPMISYRGATYRAFLVAGRCHGVVAAAFPERTHGKGFPERVPASRSMGKNNLGVRLTFLVHLYGKCA